MARATWQGKVKGSGREKKLIEGAVSEHSGTLELEQEQDHGGQIL